MKADERGIGLTSQRARDRLTGQLREMGISSVEVLHVMRTVPRHLFVDEALASRAYENTALPIGHGQTVSQPYIVARMTEALLTSGPIARVLEIGAGSGYQSAVLAHFADTVYAVERMASLVKKLRERMAALGYHNVRVRHGDGHLGWPEHAPYDAILVAAAVVAVPIAVCEQLEARRAHGHPSRRGRSPGARAGHPPCRWLRARAPRAGALRADADRCE